MSTSNTQTKHFHSTVGKIVMVFAFASMISGTFLMPAFGQGYERRQEQQRQGPQERRWHAREGQDARRWRGREWRDAHGRREYQPYGYSAPLYVPPPVVYAPRPPPGISLFLPLPLPLRIR
jgi:hypothetical protein